MVITIEMCEMAQFYETVKPIQKQAEAQQIRKPIDYNELGLKQATDEPVEDEEKVFVDLSEQHEDKIVSITDILLGDDVNGTKKR